MFISLNPFLFLYGIIRRAGKFDKIFRHGIFSEFFCNSLVGLLTAVSMFRASGAMEWLSGLCAPALDLLGIPPETPGSAGWRRCSAPPAGTARRWPRRRSPSPSSWRPGCPGDLSSLVIPVLLAGVALYGLGKRVDVYAALTRGAADGLSVLLRIIPALRVHSSSLAAPWQPRAIRRAA